MIIKNLTNIYNNDNILFILCSLIVLVVNWNIHSFLSSTVSLCYKSKQYKYEKN